MAEGADIQAIQGIRLVPSCVSLVRELERCGHQGRRRAGDVSVERHGVRVQAAREQRQAGRADSRLRRQLVPVPRAAERAVRDQQGVRARPRGVRQVRSARSGVLHGVLEGSGGRLRGQRRERARRAGWQLHRQPHRHPRRCEKA